MTISDAHISKILGDLKGMSPSGYAIGLQIAYTTPKFMFQTYSKAWLDYYSQNGLLMSDPTLIWGFENVGVVRWSEMDAEDPAGVMSKAAEYGIKYGLTCAKESSTSDGIRSIGSFAREDREFTDEEVTVVSETFNALHDNTEDQAQLAPDAVQQLKNMSIMVTHPGA